MQPTCFSRGSLSHPAACLSPHHRPLLAGRTGSCIPERAPPRRCKHVLSPSLCASLAHLCRPSLSLPCCSQAQLAAAFWRGATLGQRRQVYFGGSRAVGTGKQAEQVERAGAFGKGARSGGWRKLCPAVGIHRCTLALIPLPPFRRAGGRVQGSADSARRRRSRSGRTAAGPARGSGRRRRAAGAGRGGVGGGAAGARRRRPRQAGSQDATHNLPPRLPYHPACGELQHTFRKGPPEKF